LSEIRVEGLEKRTLDFFKKWL